MKETALIEHSGIIKEISGNKLKVSILNKSACVSCNLKSSCGVSDNQDKTVDIFTNNPQEYKLGDNVYVYFKQSLGFRALLIGYVLPFFILLFTMIVMSVITKNELLVGLVSLGILIPYYILLYLSKDKIKKTFTFSLKKSYTYPNLNIVNV